MRIGIGLGELTGRPATIDEIVAQAKEAEKDGFATGWFANIFGVDAIMACALAGRETQRIELGTAVVPSYPRHPTAMAQQAMTASAACKGRFTLGIGLSHQMVIEAMFGLSFEKPFSHMREYVSVLAPLMQKGQVNYQGEEFRVASSLSVADAKPPPLLLAALAPRMLQLCGSETDGTITWMTGPKTLREHTIPRLGEAAAKAGRPKPRVVAGLPIAVTEDVKLAREKAAGAFQVYGFLPSYRAMLDREGAAGPADVAIVGDESAVGEQLERLGEIGVTDYLAAIYPVGNDAEKSVARTRALLVRLAAKP